MFFSVSWAVFTTSNSTPGAFCWKMSWAVKSPIGSALLVDPCRPYSPFKPWLDGYLGRESRSGPLAGPEKPTRNIIRVL